jgi:hypothetical protein
MPGIEARVLLGVQPTQLPLFDDRSGGAAPLPTFDRPLYALTPASDRAFWAAGAATVLRFELERGTDGALAWSVRGTVASDLGVVTAAAAQGDTLALAGNDGGLLLFDAAPLASGPVTGSGRIASLFAEAAQR